MTDYSVHPSADVVRTAPVCNKRRENRVAIASYALDRYSRVIEGFAGVGYATEVWAASGAEIIAIEKDGQTYDALCKTVRGLPNVIPIHGDSKKIIPEYAARGEIFTVVDLDDNGNFLDVLPESLDLLRDGGYLSITCTGYSFVMRNLHQHQLVERFGEGVIELYNRENVRGDPVGNRKAFSKLVSKRVEREGAQRGFQVGTLCTEIGYRAISKSFIVNTELTPSLERCVEREWYVGPRAS